MQVNHSYPRLVNGLQKRRGKDVHPASEDNELRPHFSRCQDPLRQRGVVFLAALCDFLLILFAFLQEPVANQVKVLPRNA